MTVAFSRCSPFARAAAEAAPQSRPSTPTSSPCERHSASGSMVSRVGTRPYRLPGWKGELEAMLIYSMSVSVDGFIADREGAFAWTVPSDELFRFHTAQVRELGGYLLGRRLY